MLFAAVALKLERLIGWIMNVMLQAVLGDGHWLRLRLLQLTSIVVALVNILFDYWIRVFGNVALHRVLAAEGLAPSRTTGRPQRQARSPGAGTPSRPAALNTRLGQGGNPGGDTTHEAQVTMSL
jgi:hypothetical protein